MTSVLVQSLVLAFWTRCPEQKAWRRFGRDEARDEIARRLVDPVRILEEDHAGPIGQD